jgi:hypothetical protein
MSYVRVVRFTGVDQSRVDAINERVKENDGPPEGVPSTALKVLIDKEQGTAVVLQFFDSMDDLKTGEEVLSAMDAGDTPGTRESVDRCETVVDVSA